MPSYSFCCESCSWSGDLHNIRIGDRDSQTCPECKASLNREVIPTPAKNMTKLEGFQMHAVLGNGVKVPGQFGRSGFKRTRRY